MAKNRATKKLEEKTDEQQTYLALVKRFRQRGVSREDIPTFAKFQQDPKAEKLSLQTLLLGDSKKRDKSRAELAAKVKTKVKLNLGTKKVLAGTGGRMRSDLIELTDAAIRAKRKRNR